MEKYRRMSGKMSKMNKQIWNKNLGSKSRNKT